MLGHEPGYALDAHEVDLHDTEAADRSMGQAALTRLSIDDLSTVDEAAYVDQALRNLDTTSRTARGVVDTSASATKKDIMQIGSGAEAADMARRNVSDTMHQLYRERLQQFESPTELRSYIEDIARSINRGITAEDVVYRSGADAVNKYGYTRIADLDEAMDDFSTQLFDKLTDDTQDPLETAGWIEYRVDMTDHFFADGCGKIAKAISAWSLMRHAMPLPTYRSREELYQHAPKAIRGEDATVDQQGYDNWMTYYRSLFNEEAR